MAFVPITDVIRIVPHFTHPSGKDMVNVLYVRDNIGGEINARMTLLLGAYIGWWSNYCADHVSNEVALSRIIVTDMSVPNGAQIDFPVDDTTGNVASPALPANVTFATSFRTGFSGRSYRGRAYWIGLAESMVVGNEVTELQADYIRDAWQGFDGAVGLESMGHVLVSFVQNGVVLEQPVVTPINNYVNVDRRVDTQRRRL